MHFKRSGESEKNLCIGIILIVISALTGYVLWDFRQIEDVPHTYVKKAEIEAVFEENKEGFMQVAEFFKDKKSAMVLYDLTAKSFVTELSPSEKEQTAWIFASGFNTIKKREDALCIYLNRPTKHSINIGLCYDYQKENWHYLYFHDYDRCCPALTVGVYRLYDFIHNGGEEL